MSPRAAPRLAGQPLSTETVVAAAVEVAREASLEELSMRRVARRLGRAPMSLYRHVADLEELRRRVVEVLVGEVQIVDHGDDWRRTLTDAAHRMRDVLTEHPGILAVVMRSGMSTPSMLASLDTIAGALRRVGLDDPDVARAQSSLLGFIFGSAVVRRSVEEVLSPDGDDDLAHQQFIDSLVADSDGRYPHIEAIAPAWVAMDVEEPFSFALDRLLEGIAALAR
ncbi:TetR/AcrR family transcriptional regulator C-terminal domain-containing protein [Euzebya sp.]|uniref:TetR/AcrR family transcriptional regulator C-terminal domain-containing protein n=1 Tax=Euzebya sp. TaxID=1971409 RepID=UPI003516BFF3